MEWISDDVRGMVGSFPQFRKQPPIVSGPSLRFRSATVADAEFILSLRLDPTKNQFISKTAPDVEAQRRWLRAARDGYYFIVEHDGRPVGTIRLYDQRGTSVSWGSWILSNEAPKRAAIESTCMIYATGLDHGFKAFHFDVRRGNEKVWQYHERWGAERVRETDLDYFYRIQKRQVLEGLERYGIAVSFEHWSKA